MVVYSLYVINRSGGLIYNSDFMDVPKLDGNAYLRLASTFHSMHAISNELAPVAGRGGITVVDTDAFRLHCLQTLTGFKFFVIVDPKHANVDLLLASIYEIFADYVCKNPFYELDMPIRVELWEQHISHLMAESNK
eukprot:ANDGO_05138.mRNA.1 Trafficking protein particle complex subunit 4